MKSQPNAPNAKVGMYTMNERHRYESKTCSYGKKIGGARNEEDTRSASHAETPVQAMSCSICQSFEHLVAECPTILVMREMFRDQANVIGQFKPNNNASYGNTYNSN